MPTIYKTLSRTLTCHLAFPTAAEAIKVNSCTKPIVKSNTQKARLLPLIKPDQIIYNTNIERATAQELYNIVKQFRDEMTVGSSPAISDCLNTMTISGESPPNRTTMINIKEDRKAKMPAHIERIIEAVFSILVFSINFPSLL
jgi:hypothetical protein